MGIKSTEKEAVAKKIPEKKAIETPRQGRARAHALKAPKRDLMDIAALNAAQIYGNAPVSNDAVIDVLRIMMPATSDAPLCSNYLITRKCTCLIRCAIYDRRDAELSTTEFPQLEIYCFVMQLRTRNVR